MSRILVDITDWNHFLYSGRVISGVHRVALGLMRAMRAEGLPFQIIRFDPAAARHRFVRLDFLDQDFTTRLPEWNRLYSRISNRYAERGVSLLRKRIKQELARISNQKGGSYEACFGDAYVPQDHDVIYFCGAGWDAPETVDAVRRWKRLVRLRFVVAVHDFIPLVKTIYRNKSGSRQFRRWFRDVATVADDYLCISEFTRSDFQRFRRRLRVPPDKVPVVITNPHEFASPPASGHADGLGVNPPHKYILSVGATLSHKNGERLLEAWQLVSLWHKHDFKLVIVGGLDGAEVLKRFGSVQNLMIIPRAGDGSLEALYRGSVCTIFPSLYEGWGLPVGESLWLGKICLASNSTSIPEVGLDMCEYFDPLKVDRIAAALLKVIKTPDYIRQLERRIDRNRLKSWTAYATEVHQFLSHGAVPGRGVQQSEIVLAAAE